MDLSRCPNIDAQAIFSRHPYGRAAMKQVWRLRRSWPGSAVHVECAESSWDRCAVRLARCESCTGLGWARHERLLRMSMRRRARL